MSPEQTSRFHRGTTLLTEMVMTPDEIPTEHWVVRRINYEEAFPYPSRTIKKHLSREVLLRYHFQFRLSRRNARFIMQITRAIAL